MTDRMTETRRDKSLAQYMEALRAESASADFHALRQDFSPPIYTSQPIENRRTKAFLKRGGLDTPFAKNAQGYSTTEMVSHD